MQGCLNREAINQRLLYHMRLQSSDAAVVLGARAVSGEVAREAARQYHNGLYNKLVLTGGVRVRQPAMLLRLLLAGRLSGIIDSIKCNGLRDFLSRKCEADYMHDQLGRMAYRRAILSLSTDRRKTLATISIMCAKAWRSSIAYRLSALSRTSAGLWARCASGLNSVMSRRRACLSIPSACAGTTGTGAYWASGRRLLAGACGRNTPRLRRICPAIISAISVLIPIYGARKWA